MSPVNTRRNARRGAKVAAVVAVTGAFVASIASAAAAAPDLRALVESTTFSGTETTTTLITTTESSTTSETSSTSETSAPAPSGDEVYADLYVELDGPADDLYDGPMVFSATNRLVGDGPELTGADLTANPSEYCGDISVDVSMDPATIVVTGGTGHCWFGSAYLRIVLHGATFGSVTLVGDSLFDEPYSEQEPGDLPADRAAGFTGTGSFGASLPIMTAIVDRPTLQSYGASGELFTARWEGLTWTDMGGTASFTFVRGATGPVFAAADPVFTG